LNEMARDFYRHVLQSYEAAGTARDYLAKRGVSPEMTELFQLGYAPPGWDNLLVLLKKKGCREEQLAKLGLVTVRPNGTGHYDRFRHRLMFPIWDTRGKVIGFGGRVLDDTLPKYLNSPETPVFNKSYLLYGLHLAAQHIREQDEVIIVEGYMDVLTAHQFGVKNVAASLGTAFTREQGKLLMRYTQNVVISYDADTAGVTATLRGMEILQEIGCRVKVLSVPAGKDPDEYIRNNGPEAFMALVKNKAQSFFDYLFSRVLAKNDFHNVEGKVKVVSEIIPSIVKLHSEVEKEQQVKKVAEPLGLKTESIWSEIRKYLQKSRNYRSDRDKNVKKRDNNIDYAPGPAASPPFRKGDARRKAEEGLVYCLIRYPDLINRVQGQIDVNFFTAPEYLNIIN
ncbi:MAG: DNA primase, partial [Actinobacteria bacterium]